MKISVHHVPHNRDLEALYENSMAEAIKVPKNDEITEWRKDRAAMLLLKHRSGFRAMPAYRNILFEIINGEIGARLGRCLVIDNILTAMEKSDV